MKTSTVATSALIVVALTTFSASASQIPPVRFAPVARSGELAIGSQSAAQHRSFSNARISDSGHVTFEGAMQGPGVNTGNDFGLWAGLPGQVVNVLREGHAAPGVGAAAISDFDAKMNESGVLSIVSGLAGSNRNSVLWVGLPTSLSIAARKGDQAAGLELGAVYSGFTASSTNVFQDVSFNNVGQLTFLAHVAGTSPTHSAIWNGSPNGLQLVARVNNYAPSMPLGVTYSHLFSVLNPHGTLVIAADIQGPEITPINNTGIWVGTTHDMHLLVREGDIAPDISSAVFSEVNIGEREVDRTGNVLFHARVDGVGVDDSNRYGAWFGKPGNVQLLFRDGDPAPAIEDAYLSGFRVEIAPGGDFLMIAHLRGASVTAENDTAVFLGTPDDMRLVVREGDAAPSSPPGVRVGELLQWSQGMPVTNNGMVAFGTELTGPSVTPTNAVAYFFADASGNLRLIAREGDSFDSGNGQIKQIRTLGGTLGLPSDSTMNSTGQLLINVEFADNSEGLYVAQVVPEPNSGLLSLVCALALGIRSFVRN